MNFVAFKAILLLLTNLPIICEVTVWLYGDAKIETKFI